MTDREHRVPCRRCEGQYFSREYGFTMIEVMAVIVVVAILVAVAAPGFQDLIGNNRVLSEVYTLRATLNNARSEALARRAPVVVCPTTDGAACADSTDWSTGYMTFVDSDDNSAPDPNNPDEEIIQSKTAQPSVEIAYSNAARRVRFGGAGVALGFEGTFTFCDSRGAEDARALIINPVGSLRAATDTNSPADYIVNDAGNTNVACN